MSVFLALAVGSVFGVSLGSSERQEARFRQDCRRTSRRSRRRGKERQAVVSEELDRHRLTNIGRRAARSAATGGAGRLAGKQGRADPHRRWMG